MNKAAFFDVDNTLINAKSMVDFFLFVRGILIEEQSSITCLEQLREMQANGVDRAALNRHYFRAFKGVNAASLSSYGHRWFLAKAREDNFFKQDMVAKLHELATHKYQIVLVSSAFLPILAPIAKALHCETILCTEPQVIDGTLTGEIIGKPCIGAAKKDKIHCFSLLNGIDLSESWAYGDNTDTLMLESVGNSVWVDNECSRVIADVSK